MNSSNTNSIVICFQNKKAERTCNWHLKNFAKESALILPKTAEQRIALLRERGLDKLYSDKNNREFYPTEDGWDSFLSFIYALHQAEPFSRKSTINDVFQNYNTAFANMLSEKLLPENHVELVDYLPEEFINELTARSERRYSLLCGIDLKVNYFIYIGNCWIGNYGLFSYDCIKSSKDPSKKTAYDTINTLYKERSPIIAGSLNFGTSSLTKQENTFQNELSISILTVLLNLSYENSFYRLWTIKRMARPEQGLSRQLDFSIIKADSESSDYSLSCSMQFTLEEFEISNEMIDMWHGELCLDIINKIIYFTEDESTDIRERFINSLLYFRQATQQATPEMQLSTLWTCIESIFTANNKNILKPNIIGLLAITIKFLPISLWPKNSDNILKLEKIFDKYYKYRSKTYHHAKRNHVSQKDVQEFSIVVCGFIIGISQLINLGYASSENILEHAENFVQNIKQQTKN